MKYLDKQRFIQQKARENQADPQGIKVRWSQHATAELVNDDLTRADVEAALIFCEVVEEYPEWHRPLPDCLVLGSLLDGRPIHAVVALDEANDRIFMVTVYLPSIDRWHDDWRTRR
jgi:hypothetical protein